MQLFVGIMEKVLAWRVENHSGIQITDRYLRACGMYKAMREEKMKNEAEQIINFLLTQAKEDYELEQHFNGLLDDAKKKLEDNPELFYTEIKTDLKECFKLLNDPGCIQDKKFALSVCNALIQSSLENEGMKEGSIMHLLSLRLYDYINRMKL